MAIDWPFDHIFGACVNGNDHDVYLCFNLDSADSKKCRKASAPMNIFEEISASNYEHTKTRIAASPGRQKS